MLDCRCTELGRTTKSGFSDPRGAGLPLNQVWTGGGKWFPVGSPEMPGTSDLG